MSKAKKPTPGPSSIKNKKAFFNYTILERIEVGLELTGTEIKSIRQGKVSMVDAYCKLFNDREIFLHKMNISTYEKGGYSNHDPIRKRRLLLHRREIVRIRNKLIVKGHTLIPLKIYFHRGWAKMEIGLAKGKSQSDKRQSLREKDARREIKNFS